MMSEDIKMIPTGQKWFPEMGYNGSTLRVKYHTGSVFDYFDVPQSLYDELAKSEDAGKLFHDRCSRGFFKSVEVK